MTIAHKLPLFVPMTGINGEKANDKADGVMVLIVILSNPNDNPKNAPILGPKTIPPIITGMCTSVAFIKPKLINPSGVKENKMMIAKNIAVSVKRFVFTMKLLFIF